MKMLDYTFSTNFLPHLHCFAGDDLSLWLNVIGNLGIFLAYMAIPARLLLFLSRQDPKIMRGRKAVLTLFATFIFSCGITHLLDVIVLWHPIYRAQTYWILWTALISLFTAIFIFGIGRIKITSYQLLKHGVEITEIQLPPQKIKKKDLSN